jgi:hypothetical protein
MEFLFTDIGIFVIDLLLFANNALNSGSSFSPLTFVSTPFLVPSSLLFSLCLIVGEPGGDSDVEEEERLRGDVDGEGDGDGDGV